MNKIINIVKKKKSIPIDKFIDISLYDKKFGYYMKKNPFGNKGDFITSPLISNLFGEMIAIWCISFWEHLNKPKKISIVELGPGDGSLCQSLLNAFKNFEDFYKCFEIKLFEKSMYLKKIQKKRIRNQKVKWIKKIDKTINEPTIFLGNEFFDALPIKQLFLKRKLFFERHVALTKNKKKLEFIYKKAKKKLIRDITKLNLSSGDKVIEYPMEAIRYLEIISRCIKKNNGCLLTFDYGYTEKKSQDTLQSVKQHKYFNILSEPGSADITSHVNYNLFSKVLNKNKLKVEKIVSQNEFLQKMGIIERANILSRNISFKAKADMYFRLKKILHYEDMGNLFKVLLAKKRGTNFSLGF